VSAFESVSSSFLLVGLGGVVIAASDGPG
jgi:hypothetical protein